MRNIRPLVLLLSCVSLSLFAAPRKNGYDKIFWVDLETTGLNSGLDADQPIDQILEIAGFLTDTSFNRVADAPTLVIHHPKKVLDGMGEWCKNQHGKSKLIQDVRKSTLSLEDAENETLKFIKQHCDPEKKNLFAGSSVAFDQGFIRRHMPKVCEFFHHHILDVTVLITTAKFLYPGKTILPWVNVPHRARADIEHSYTTLRTLMPRIFKSADDPSLAYVPGAKPQLLDEQCPQCAAKKLRVVQGKYGPFTSCSGYPRCKYIKTIEADFACPSDGGTVVEDAASNKGGKFWRCSNRGCSFSTAGMGVFNETVNKIAVLFSASTSRGQASSSSSGVPGILGTLRVIDGEDEIEKVASSSASSGEKRARTLADVTDGSTIENGASSSAFEGIKKRRLDETCPTCNKFTLHEVHGKNGFFTSCSGFPQCRYVKNKEAGFLCPKDGGTVVERVGKNGLFWACKNYPNCKFTKDKEVVTPLTSSSADTQITSSSSDTQTCESCQWPFQNGRCTNTECEVPLSSGPSTPLKSWLSCVGLSSEAL